MRSLYRINSVQLNKIIVALTIHFICTQESTLSEFQIFILVILNRDFYTDKSFVLSVLVHFGDSTLHDRVEDVGRNIVGCTIPYTSCIGGRHRFCICVHFPCGRFGVGPRYMGSY